MVNWWKKEYYVSLVFLGLCVLCFIFSEVSFPFLLNQVIKRFTRDGIMVLALIVPIVAGMGLNFAVTVGAMTAQGVLIFILNYNFFGTFGLLLAFLISIILSIIFGILIGNALNVVKGKEMITSIIIGFLANYLYQLVFMVGFGTVITVHNKEIVLSKGIGVNNMVDLAPFNNTLNKIGLISINGVEIPLFMICMVLIFSYMIYYLLNTRLGQRIRSIGMSEERAENIGIDVNRTRVIALVISTVIAAIGQFVFVQDMGMINVYTGHLNTDVFSCAALLAGGATIKNAQVKNALLGIFLLHTLFILSPLAGQNVFNNVSLGEYFRSFVAYGTIAFALIMNLKYDSAK
ncbi:MAG: ABC transporter permease subunit [Bacillota bacterium]|jgi:simple sugar transport system permease protein